MFYLHDFHPSLPKESLKFSSEYFLWILYRLQVTRSSKKAEKIEAFLLLKLKAGVKAGERGKEAHKIIRSLLFFITYSTDHDNDSNNCFSSQNVQRIKFEQIWEKQKSFLPFSFFNETKKIRDLKPSSGLGFFWNCAILVFSSFFYAQLRGKETIPLVSVTFSASQSFNHRQHFEDL